MHYPTDWFSHICTQLGGDCYVIGRRDAFFLTPSDRKKDTIYRLTGFTGSSATVLVTAQQTFLYVDSRYTLQAKNQSPDCTVITCTQPIQTLANQVTSGQKLMLSPWAWSAKEIDAYQLHATTHGWSLILDHACVLDHLIGPKPMVSRSAIQSIGTMPSFQEKCAMVFTEKTQDHWILCTGSDIAWLTNLRASDQDYAPFLNGYLFVSRTSTGFSGILYTALPRFTDPMDPALTLEPFEHLNLLPWNTWTKPDALCLDNGLLNHDTNDTITPDTSILHNKTDDGNDKPLEPPHGASLLDHDNVVVYDPGQTPSGLVQHWWIPGDFSKKLACARSIKTPWEAYHMQQAHISDGVALTKFLYWLDTHKQLADENEWSAAEQLAFFRSQGTSYRGASFPTISAMGTNSAMIHYTPEPALAASLTHGLYLIDSGGQYHFGTTDVTRTLWLGEKNRASLLHKQRYTQVLQGHIHLSQMIFPEGTNGMQLDAIARSFLWQKGLDYGHSTGHGVGCFAHVHEAPPIIASRAPQDPIKEHMIFSIEPGFYQEDWGGIRLENLVLVVRHDAQRLRLTPLTLAPFDRTLILRYELSPEHCRWLNQYHDRVYRTLAPMLDPWEERWLKEQTQSLSVYADPLDRGLD